MKRDIEGRLKGRANIMVDLDTRKYRVQFTDDSEVEYLANMIAEHMYAQSDLNDNQTLLLKLIVDNKTERSAAARDKVHITVSKKTNRKEAIPGLFPVLMSTMM